MSFKKKRCGISTRAQTKNKCPLIELDAFIVSLLSNISSIMTTVGNENTISEIDRDIKIYLTNLHIVQKHVNDIHPPSRHEDNMHWLKKYNFQS